MKKIITIGICNICVIVNAFSQCTVEKTQEFQEANQICHDGTVSESTTIDAMNFTTIKDGLLRVGGDVCISMGDQKISAAQLLYDDKAQNVSIKTPLRYSDQGQVIDAQTAQIDLKNNQATLNDIEYLIKASDANGRAEQISTDENISHLTGLTYSTCPPNDQQWYISAQKADIDQKKQVGTFRKMTLRFKDVPLLYFPYAKLPLSDQRHTGLLIPQISNNSRTGFDYAQPYYINIAENMDATITPRYMSERGFMLGAEFRYLGENYRGEFYGDYLPSDKGIDRDRGFAEFKHSQRFANNWSINTQLKNVSDDAYFQDFGNNINATSQVFLQSFLNVTGFGDNWLFNGRFNDYQIISDTIALNRQPYQTLPSVQYSWFNNSITSSLNYGIDASWDNFYREDSLTANRFDIMPYVEKTFQNSYSRFTPRLAYRSTYWSYDDEQFSTINNLDDSRSLPIVSLDYSINFEKQFSDGGYSTIEPRLFYVYSPFRNQQNIALFDTHELTFGTALLYQTNAFSGADRQSDANQFSLGVTQRHFDNSGAEKWNFTVGQIIYLQDRKVQLNNTVATRNTSPLITEFNYFYRNWKASMSLHWDNDIDEFERALVKFQRKGKNNSLFNFAYRLRRGRIEQLDTSVVLPINEKNRFIARWNYSVDDNQTIEALAGIEHKNCCWATRLVFRRHVFNEQGDVNNGIFFEIQLNGLGAIGRNPRRLLNQSILGYSEEF